MRKLLIGLIKLYQWCLSPFIGASCRFDPSCSSYAIEAINKYGALKGGYLTVLRLGRCHPWCDGGHDPVP
ncbi:MAG: membrane protein insertion efficiency factor YidD [Methylophilaceae bacterium]|nr:MAG: membrane protein insertion efficiency factor YidD [Methylophilaceae bacterium]